MTWTPPPALSIDRKVLDRIRKQGPGAIFMPVTFLDLGSRAAIDLVLHRLCKKGVIRRLARGLYDFPKSDPALGLLSPSIDAIAKALAGKDGSRLQPSGAYAANLLRLSEQVPMKVVFLTDGASRKVSVGKQLIILKRTSPRNMATAGRSSGLVIQAFRHLGRTHVTWERVAHLETLLHRSDRKGLLADLRFAAGWMHPFLRKIALGKGRT